MADQNSVEVRITGSVDPSVAQATQQVSTQLRLTADQYRALGSTVGMTKNQMVDLAVKAAGAATAGSGAATLMRAGLNETETATHGLNLATSGVIQEYIRLGHEAMTGSFSRIPGSLVVMASRMGGLQKITASTILTFGGIVAAIGAVGYALVEATIRAEAFARAIEHGLAAGVLAPNKLIGPDIDKVAEYLDSFADVSRADALKVTDALAGVRGMTSATMQEMAERIHTFSHTTGQDINEVAAKFTSMLKDPVTEGKKFMDMLGASAKSVDDFNRAASQGQSQALSVILKTLAQQTDALAAKSGVASREYQTAWTQAYNSLSGLHLTEAERLRMVQNEMDQTFGAVRTQSAQRFVAAMADAKKQTDALPPSLEQVRLKVEDIGAQSGRTRVQIIHDQIAELESALKTTKTKAATAEEQFDLERLIAAKRVELAAAQNTESRKFTAEEKRDKLDALKQIVDADEAGTQKQLQDLFNLYNGAVEIYGRLSTQATAAFRQVEVAQEQYIKKIAQGVISNYEQEWAQTKGFYDRQNAEVAQSVQFKEMSIEQGLAKTLQNDREEYQSRIRLLNDEVAVEEAAGLSIIHTKEKITQASITEDQKELAAKRQAIQEMVRQYQQAYQPITSAFDNMVSNILTTNMTASQILKKALADLLINAIKADVTRLEHFIFTKKAEVKVNEIGNAAKTASDTAAQDTSLLGQIDVAIKSIMTDAAKVYGDVFAYLSPYMGPAAAIPAAAASATVIAAEALIPALDVGTMNVPQDMIAQIHQGEMVIPKSFADDIRAGNSGGLGGEVHFHGPFISAWDTRTGADAFQEMLPVFAKGLQRYYNNNPSARPTF